MAGGDRVDRRAKLSWLPLVLALGLGLAAMGQGPLNGDAVVYAAQAEAGEGLRRVVHVGVLLPLTWLAQWLPPQLALDGRSHRGPPVSL